MSIRPHTGHCQELVTAITGTLAPLFSLPGRAPVTLALHTEQLAMLAAAWAPAGAKGIILAGNRKDGQDFHQEVTAWQATVSPGETWHLVAGQLTPQEQQGEIVTAFSRALHFLYNRTRKQHYIFLVEEALPNFPDPSLYRQQSLELHTGETQTTQRLISHVAAAGYVRYASSIEPGGFRVRGEQIDIYHPIFPGVVTITFYGNVIESIVQKTGRRSSTIARCRVPPVALPGQPVPLAEVVASLTVFSPASLSTLSRPAVIYDSLNPTVAFPWQAASLPQLLPVPRGFILYENRDRVMAYVRDHELERVTVCRSPLARRAIKVHNKEHFILSEAALFPVSADTEKPPLSYQQGLALLAELREGKPAVHDDHGIGIYEGLATRRINNIEREYLLLRYAAGDVLSVPVEFAHKVTAYLGEKSPVIHRLGGRLWMATRKKAQRDAEAFAHELLATASAREGRLRPRYDIDEALENELAAGFPYMLTADQDGAWAAVKMDLAKTTPMDRLIVGDVGFGKTEIAIRAAAHVVANGKQVALLAPTTLLVQQHADTLLARLPHLAARVGVLSRFTTPAQARRVREKLSRGEISIAVGTQALLAKSTPWQNLGLVIIDEEQRFGVIHKEHFKKLRAVVDILSLSATPIPRTLSMALSGLKELSVITTAPLGRRSILTHVGADEDTIITQAIERELARGGQVYVVSPKIRGLGTLARRVARLAPEAAVAQVHGQLPSKTLAKLMHQFDTGEIDVLVSSSIIENGLDVPNANTLIVVSATHFGLAELYQLRGRVGRRARQGYAYFLYTQQELTGLQRQRLTALTESARLGAGWSLAQRDLEIRGAGNLLGAEQSGTVQAVGAQLYLDMIREALDTTGGALSRSRPPEIHLPVSAIIPATYIALAEERIHYYQILSRSVSAQQLATRWQGMVDLYGAPPPELENLSLLLNLQLAAAARGIGAITHQAITPVDETPYSRLLLAAENLPTLVIPLAALGNWEVRGNKLTLDVDEITPEFVRKLVEALQAGR